MNYVTRYDYIRVFIFKTKWLMWKSNRWLTSIKQPNTLHFLKNHHNIMSFIENIEHIRWQGLDIIHLLYCVTYNYYSWLLVKTNGGNRENIWSFMKCSDIIAYVWHTFQRRKKHQKLRLKGMWVKDKNHFISLYKNFGNQITDINTSF